MAAIAFLAGENFTINTLSGSGLGFYGVTHGVSVPVGQYQKSTWITNSAGTAMGPQADNFRYLNSQSGVVGSASDGSGLILTALPNYQATVAFEFTHSTAVQVQNATLYGFDRVSYLNAPTGVTLFGAEIIHVDDTQVDNGSGSVTWTELAGSGSYLSLSDSPGVSGFYAGPGGRADDHHRWHCVLSASPDTIGSKTFGAYLELEYW